jgi:hypothetical protein
MSQQPASYEGGKQETAYQPSLETKPSLTDRAQQVKQGSALLTPDWRFLISDPPPVIEEPLTRRGQAELGVDVLDRSTSNQANRAPFRKIFQMPIFEPSKHFFRPIQQWRGTVIEIRDSEFDAELRDQTDLSRGREISTFKFDEVSEGDERLVKVGAVFYWSIGYELTESRQRKLVATVVFRRLPGWSKSEVAAVHEKAAEIEQLLGIENAARRAARS